MLMTIISFKCPILARLQVSVRKLKFVSARLYFMLLNSKNLGLNIVYCYRNLFKKTHRKKSNDIKSQNVIKLAMTIDDYALKICI